MGVNADQVGTYSAFYTLMLIQCQQFFKEHIIVTYVKQHTETIYWKICGTILGNLDDSFTLFYTNTSPGYQKCKDPSTHSLTSN